MSDGKEQKVENKGGQGNEPKNRFDHVLIVEWRAGAGAGAGAAGAGAAGADAAGTGGIPQISVGDLLRSIHLEFVADFSKTFKIGKNATITCTNADIPRFNNFITRWTAYFRECEMVVNELGLQVLFCLQLSAAYFAQPCYPQIVGGGQIQVVNANKIKLMKIYGAAYQLFIRSNRFLGQQPSSDYTNVVLVEFVE
jgi:hypothetical protein